MFSYKVYVAIFYINSKNLFNNLNVIKSYLKQNIKLCAMVKADAYSHSSKHICKLLCDKVDYFGVANIQEGIAIRKLKISTPILCVGTFFKEDLRLASKFNIDLTIHSKHCLKILKNFKNPASAPFSPIPPCVQFIAAAMVYNGNSFLPLQ